MYKFNKHEMVGVNMSKVSEVRLELITSRSTLEGGGGQWLESTPRYLEAPEKAFFYYDNRIETYSLRSTTEEGRDLR